jgi:predicted nucleotidyltransferase
VLPGNVNTRVVSVPALAPLKIVCWQDRRYRYLCKDARDLNPIMRDYLFAGNEDRLWGTFASSTMEDDFDYQRAGARMLGSYVRSLLDKDGVERIGGILAQQSDRDTPGGAPATSIPGSTPARGAQRKRACAKARWSTCACVAWTTSG